MNTLKALGWWDSGAINHEISNLTKENVSRDPSGFAVRIAVWASVDESKSSQIRSSLENGEVSRIADELGHVVKDNGLAD
jgi:hypothetical protein